ncbi:30S ribosomal protein S15 [Levilactobacillus acidifarinae]|nr:30S ribosomal protein S15 [Levilactobacillus acidifarinae]
MDMKDVARRSQAIRERYHQLELKQDGHTWTTEQDALAFLTDAGLVGRQIIARTGSWPADGDGQLLRDKLGESIWWLTILAQENGIDIEQATAHFLETKEIQLKK